MKLKTNKAVAKKVKVRRGSKNLKRRYSKQNHNNAKETGKFKRKKRRNASLFKADEKNIKKALPYVK